ncbi:hypothetical protein PG999_005565 [Apiospora kogelbergensis]|uniref:Uncharacterized protein n=1 Tax=Apiospora kogelbergensis TaxID=1337665 RepID=A0AAW0R2K7_9PEZI
MNMERWFRMQPALHGDAVCLWGLHPARRIRNGQALGDYRLDRSLVLLSLAHLRDCGRSMVFRYC